MPLDTHSYKKKQQLPALTGNLLIGLNCRRVCVAGYMCCNSVLDKDGVSAAAIAAEMVSYLATKNKALSQQLTSIYEE